MGSRADFERYCVERSADPVNFATLVTGRAESGRDLAQDALLEVWRRWSRVGVDDLDAYLHTIVIRRHQR